MRVQGILERLDAGEIVVGDGGFVFALEKRGYVKAGPWTPEAAAEHPEAGTWSRAITASARADPELPPGPDPRVHAWFQCASCTESS